MSFSLLPLLPLFLLGALLAAPALSGSPAPSARFSQPQAESTHRPAMPPPAQPVQTVPLAGPLANANAEVSGLTWHGPDLLLLPQHPFRMSGRADHGLLFALSRDKIEAFLSGRRDGPLRPRPVTLLAPALEERSPVYQGCEALAVRGERAYLASEAVADAETGAMRGFLFAGRLRGDTLRLNTRRRATLPPQTQAPNMAYETLISSSTRVAAIYEANGRNVNPQPRAALFSPALQRLQKLAFPPLEYRLTDATAMDSKGRFWVMNYFFPGEREKLDPARDPLSSARSPSSIPLGPVERLVEFQLDKNGFRRTSAPPLRLSPRPGTPRNWEGLARYKSAARGPGFLLITDQYPGTVLGFVPREEVQ